MTRDAIYLRADGERCGAADATEDAWSNCDDAADVFDRPRAEREAYIREAVSDSYARLNEQYQYEQASAATGIGLNGSECPPDPVFWRAVIDSYCATLQEQLRIRFAEARGALAKGYRAERAPILWGRFGASIARDVAAAGVFFRGATWEFPGFVSVWNADGTYYEIGNNNATWCADLDDGYGHVAGISDSGIPRDSRDRAAIVRWILTLPVR